MRKIDDQHIVCMIGFYLCCVLFFADINASAANVKFLAIVETYETVLKVSWPDLIHEYLFSHLLENDGSVANVKACVSYLLILFAEHTPTGLIPKVPKHEQQIPRVGRWNVHQISDFISRTNMTEFSPTASFAEEFSQLQKQTGIETVEPSKEDLKRWLREQTIENGKLK
ncbi:hypothetical protein C5167_047117 [Papaver somniferum]|uniref:Uncharacterized protein n=1 Tax=Papaver somniferum TaxID=3469 RepID=A0A4Y7LI58_PAPSO|nr:hypothetical protein C5167_047117 [Papaver somniferum]